MRSFHGECVRAGFVAFALGCAGEPRILPPRAAPAREVPSVPLPLTPVSEQQARVVLDTLDGPMLVTAKYDPSFVPPGGPPSTTRSGELCTTPCYADLPRGKYRFFLSATAGTDPSLGDTDDVRFDEPGVYVYRRAPGRYDTPSPTDQIAPGAIIVLSSVAFTAGMFLLIGENSNPVAGGALTLAGMAGGVAGGIWVYDSTRAEKQEGQSTVFRLK